MKRILLSALIGVGLLAVIFQVLSGSAAARPPVDYPLVCRGGPTLPIYIAPGVTNIGFKFTHSTKPASEGLLPGQCSWVDRGMYDAEPDRVSQHVEEGITVPGAPKFPESLKVYLAPENRWYEELHSSEKYWTFMVSNNGRGQLIATSARPNASTATTTFTPPSEGLRTFYVSHKWHNDRANCENPFAFSTDADDVPAGQVLVGYVNNYYGGSGPFPCEWNSKIDYRGAIWFDLSEIYNQPSLQTAEKATLKFKTVEGSVAAYDDERRPITRVCEDRLWVANADLMKGFPDRVNSYSGDTHFPTSDPIAAINGCPPGGCSIDVTEVVNKWITGKIDRYGFVIVGENEDWLDKLIPHDKTVCETRYTDFSLTVTYRPALLAIPPISPTPTPTPKEPLPIPGGPGDKLDTRKNCALGGTATASSTRTGSFSFSPSAVIDGERRGINFLKGGGWISAAPTNNDWLQVDFGDFKYISEIDVYMLRDDFTNPEAIGSELTFTKYGLFDFEVQYRSRFGVWTDVLGEPGGKVTGNDRVLRRFTFPELRTRQIRVLASKTPDGFTRLTEVEALCK